ncbi:MAG: GNAT family N-acetyltransferase [Rhodothermales bacterium]
MSTTPFLVHRASPSDLDTVSSLFDAYRVFYEQSSDIASARRFMQERLTKQDSVVFLALNHDGKGLGFTQLYPLFSSVRMRSIWLLNDLFVDKDARRMGVAHALMEHARDFARASGAAGLELATAKDNESAKSVYHDLGWKLDTEFDHYSITV